MKRFWTLIKNVGMRFSHNNCALHAAGLTYFSMLSLVPILCLLLFFAKFCHLDQYARTQINAKIDAMISNVEHGQDDVLAELTAAEEQVREEKRLQAQGVANQMRQLSDSVFSRIENFDEGTLGWVGLGFLMWTVIGTLTMIERCFNCVWEVPKGRPIWQRLYLYLFIALVVPLMAIVAMSMPILATAKDVIVSTLGATWLTKWVGDGLVWFLDLWVLQWLVSLTVSSFAFGFIFWIMPNCSVRYKPCFWGGLVTAILFGLLMKVCAVAQVGIANSSALYGSVAVFPILLAWTAMSWQVVFLGANFVREIHGPARETKVGREMKKENV